MAVPIAPKPTNPTVVINTSGQTFNVTAQQVSLSGVSLSAFFAFG
jgi:hypothetical protein